MLKEEIATFRSGVDTYPADPRPLTVDTKLAVETYFADPRPCTVDKSPPGPKTVLNDDIATFSPEAEI